jgi:hypothetical protein
LTTVSTLFGGRGVFRRRRFCWILRKHERNGRGRHSKGSASQNDPFQKATPAGVEFALTGLNGAVVFSHRVPLNETFCRKSRAKVAEERREHKFPSEVLSAFSTNSPSR